METFPEIRCRYTAVKGDAHTSLPQYPKPGKDSLRQREQREATEGIRASRKLCSERGSRPLRIGRVVCTWFRSRRSARRTGRTTSTRSRVRLSTLHTASPPDWTRACRVRLWSRTGSRPGATGPGGGAAEADLVRTGRDAFRAGVARGPAHRRASRGPGHVGREAGAGSPEAGAHLSPPAQPAHRPADQRGAARLNDGGVHRIVNAGTSTARAILEG